MAQYASAHIGEEFDAVISSVCSFGVFARTEKLFEGLISVEELFSPRARVEFDEERMTLRAGGRTYRLGDKIRICIARADVPSGQIDFAPAIKEWKEEKTHRDSRSFAKKDFRRSSGKKSFDGKKSFEGKKSFDGKKNFRKGSKGNFRKPKQK